MFTQAFDNATVSLNAVSTLTFTIENTPTEAVALLAFTNTLPAGIAIADPAQVAHDCGPGTLTAPFGGNTITFSGGELLPATTCTLTIGVEGIAAGNQMNTTGDLTSSAGNSGSSTASLFVDDTAPRFSKAFAPTMIDPGDVSTLTFSMENIGPDTLLVSSFVDNLPAGVVLADPVNDTTDCNMGMITAAAGGSTLSFTAATLPGFSSCTASVDVTAAAPGTYINTSEDYMWDFGATGKATAQLIVVAGPPPPPPPTAPPVTDIPTASDFGLLLLALALGWMALRALRTGS